MEKEVDAAVDVHSCQERMMHGSNPPFPSQLTPLQQRGVTTTRVASAVRRPAGVPYSCPPLLSNTTAPPLAICCVLFLWCFFLYECFGTVSSVLLFWCCFFEGAVVLVLFLRRCCFFEGAVAIAYVPQVIRTRTCYLPTTRHCCVPGLRPDDPFPVVLVVDGPETQAVGTPSTVHGPQHGTQRR